MVERLSHHLTTIALADILCGADPEIDSPDIGRAIASVMCLFLPAVDHLNETDQRSSCVSAITMFAMSGRV